jgi:hypothetical protein
MREPVTWVDDGVVASKWGNILIEETGGCWCVSTARHWMEFAVEVDAWAFAAAVKAVGFVRAASLHRWV